VDLKYCRAYQGTNQSAKIIGRKFFGTMDYLMKQLIFACVATMLLLSAGALHAECAFPSADGLAIPDGSTASKEELLAAIQRVKEYQATMLWFRDCLDADLAAEEQPPSVEAQQFYTLRFNSSITSEEEVAARLNAEIRAFKARAEE
jgi:hypothetical protein